MDKDGVVFATDSSPAPVVIERGSAAQWKTIGLLAFTLLALTVVVTRGIHTGEFDYNVDESQHAATGLYFADLLKDIPFAHLVHYTYLYYAQYPALSGLIHWPPLFYVCEGLIFFVFGPSVVTARIAILVFAALAWLFWFRLVKEIQNRWAAALSTVVFALLPSVLLFEKAVMLEIPSLALSIAALYYWYGYITDEKASDLYRFAVFASLALLTKQNALFLAPFCAFTIVVLRKWKLVLNRHMAIAFGIVVVLTGPFYTLVYLVHWKTVAMDLLGNSSAGIHADQLLFYWRALPQHLPWPLLLLSCLGMATSRWWSTRQATVFMLLWIVSVYLTFTFMSQKDPRYAFYWIPPFTYFAVGPLTAAWRITWMRLAGAICATLILGMTVYSGSRYRRPFLSGYASVARDIVQRSRSGIILFDGDLPANFIFFLRSFDASRRFLVLRKSLYVTRIELKYGSEELAHSKDEVRDVVSRDGVKYIVLSHASNLHFDVQRSLRDLLDTDPQFKLLKVFPIETNQTEWKDRQLRLYQNTDYHPPTEELLRIRMLTLSHDIVVPWSELKQTW